MHAHDPAATEAPVQAGAPPGCSLDATGLRLQRARYRELARSVKQLRRRGDRLVVDFAADLDAQTLERALAVERDCCPFYTFAFDARRRRLQVGVCEARLAPALEPLAAALSGGEGSPTAPPREGVG